MTQFRANVLANVAGQLVASAIQFLMIPQYVRFLGTEAYGLVGFSLTLQSIFQLFDLGISPTVNRELARYSVQPAAARDARDFVRTFELLYCGGGCVLGALLVLFAPAIQQGWLNTSELPAAAVVDALRMMGIFIAAQWPLSFYQGGLLGLGRHGVMNAIRIGMTSLTAAGAVVVLSRISATAGAFFRWQAIASGLYVIATAAALWRYLPRGPRPARVRISLIRQVWGFAAGMTGIAITGLVLTQVDKVVLSRVAPLADFGVYTVAAALASGLYTIIAPMFASVFPRFSSLVAAHDVASTAALYRRTWGMAAVLLVPTAAVVAFFAHDLLRLWTRSEPMATAGAPIVALLVTGTALNGLMNVPYALQLAHGWTAAPLRFNVMLAAAAVPAAILLTRTWGPVGAACVWPGANAIYLAVMVPLTHREFPYETRGRWIAREIPLTVVAAVIAAAALHGMLRDGHGALAGLLAGAAAWGIAVAAGLAMNAELRRALRWR